MTDTTKNFNYTTFEVKMKNGENKRFYAPDSEELFNILDVDSIQQKLELKTTKTIDYLIVTTNSNKLRVLEIIDKNIKIENIFDNFSKSTIIKNSSLGQLLKVYSSQKSSTYMTTIGDVNYQGFKWIAFPFSVNYLNKLAKAELVKDTGKPVEKENKNSNKGKMVAILDKNNSKRMPLCTKADTTLKEEKILSLYLNYYLNDLGLKAISDTELPEKALFNISTLGDKYFGLYLDTLVEENKFLESNRSQQAMLAILGYPEFLSASEHLAGTFFEAIYYSAVIQENQDVLEKIHSVVDSLMFKNEKKAVVSFED